MQERCTACQHALHPRRTYKHDGWQGYGHWLGTGTVAHKDQQFLPFKKALLYARSLKLKSQKEWRRGARAVHGLPTCPPPQTNLQARRVARVRALAGHWHSCCQRPAVPAVQEGAAARTLPQAEKQEEWEAWCKSGARPANMPSNPDRTYKHDGWQGYGHWLGTGNVGAKDQQFLPFKKALLYARSLTLKRARGEVVRRPVSPPCPTPNTTSTRAGKGTGTGWAQQNYQGPLPCSMLQHGNSFSNSFSVQCLRLAAVYVQPLPSMCSRIPHSSARQIKFAPVAAEFHHPTLP